MKRWMVALLCLALGCMLAGCEDYASLTQSIEQAAQAVSDMTGENLLPAVAEASKAFEKTQTPEAPPAPAPEEPQAPAAAATPEEVQTPAETEAPGTAAAPVPEEETAQKPEPPAPAAEPPAAEPPVAEKPVAPVPEAEEAADAAGADAASEDPAEPAPGANEAPAGPTVLESVLAHFEEIAKFPRASGSEEALSAYLQRWARSEGLQSVKDEAGNLIIDKPAAEGYEQAPRTILHAHMDAQIPAGSAADFDPAEQGVELRLSGTKLSGYRTGLGADGGIGMATALHLLSAGDISHGPLRVIFTAGKEAGMAGASALSVEYLQDAQYLISLDWKEAESLGYGAAGEAVYRFDFIPAWKAPAGSTAYEITLSGLSGGTAEAGAEKGYANAIKVLAGLMQRAYREGLSPEIASFAGGTEPHLVADTAVLQVVIHDADAELFENLVAAQIESFEARYGETEARAAFTCSKLGELPAQVLYPPVGQTLCDALYLFPSGLNTVQADGSGVMESYCNLGCLHFEEGALYFELYTYSFAQAVAAEQEEKLQMLSAFCDCDMRRVHYAPVWTADPQNHLAALYGASYKLVADGEMEWKRGGHSLECGMFLSKNPDLYCIAAGPAIEDEHTQQEALLLDTVEPHIEALAKTLAVIADE